MGDLELETLSPRPAARRRSGQAGSADARSPAGSLLRLQGMAGNSAVAALVQRTRTGQSPTPASIGEALSQVKATTQPEVIKQLQPWEIFRLVTANTPEKSRLYAELRAAWSALETAKAHLSAAEDAVAKAAAAPAASAGAARGKHSGKARKSVDVGARRTAAAKAVDTATDRVNAAIEALKTFILENNDPLRKVKADERSLPKTLKRAQAALAALKRRGHPSPDKLRESEQAVTELQSAVAGLPKRRQDVIAEVKRRIAATPFAPEAEERTVYSFEIEGETVRLHDRVDAWATKFENGLDEVGHQVGTHLDDVLARTGLGASDQKILRGISDNESGSSPWSAVNTYDRAVLTWGLVQWTGGSQSDLTAALTAIKAIAPDSFAERFEKYGIDVVDDQLVITAADGSTATGDAAALAVLNSPMLSAVFSRAGFDAKFQEAEVAAAHELEIAGPLRATFDVDGAVPKAGEKDKPDSAHGPAPAPAPAPRKGNKVSLRFSQVLTSEFAVALFADRVVNAGKPKTQKAVADAVRAYVKRKGVDPNDVATWAADAEKSLIPLLSPYPKRVKKYVSRGCSQAAGSYTP